MRTKAVFSLTPVSLDAFLTNLSSMLSVVLMHISMHQLCILVKVLFLKDNVVNHPPEIAQRFKVRNFLVRLIFLVLLPISC